MESDRIRAVADDVGPAPTSAPSADTDDVRLARSLACQAFRVASLTQTRIAHALDVSRYVIRALPSKPQHTTDAVRLAEELIARSAPRTSADERDVALKFLRLGSARLDVQPSGHQATAPAQTPTRRPHAENAQKGTASADRPPPRGTPAPAPPHTGPCVEQIESWLAHHRRLVLLFEQVLEAIRVER